MSWKIGPNAPNILSYDLMYEGGHCNSSGQYTTTATSVTEKDLGLDKGSNYTVRIRAANAFTSGEWSESIDLQTSSTR